jgi:hypothetical protein
MRFKCDKSDNLKQTEMLRVSFSEETDTSQSFRLKK